MEETSHQNSGTIAPTDGDPEVLKQWGDAVALDNAEWERRYRKDEERLPDFIDEDVFNEYPGGGDAELSQEAGEAVAAAAHPFQVTRTTVSGNPKIRINPGLFYGYPVRTPVTTPMYPGSTMTAEIPHLIDFVASRYVCVKVTTNRTGAAGSVHEITDLDFLLRQNNDPTSGAGTDNVECFVPVAYIEANGDINQMVTGNLHFEIAVGGYRPVWHGM